MVQCNVIGTTPNAHFTTTTTVTLVICHNLSFEDVPPNLLHDKHPRHTIWVARGTARCRLLVCVALTEFDQLILWVAREKYTVSPIASACMFSSISHIAWWLEQSAAKA